MHLSDGHFARISNRAVKNQRPFLSMTLNDLPQLTVLSNTLLSAFHTFPKLYLPISVYFEPVLWLPFSQIQNEC